MPTYEYRCLDCNLLFERFQSMTDDPIDTCPECQGNVKRLIGRGAGIIFKGEGFYQTDYRSSSYKDDAKKETSGSKKSDKKDAASPKAEATTS